MTRYSTLCVVVVLVVAGGAPAVTAQPGDSPQPTTQQNSTQQGEQVDSDLRLVSSAYNGKGTATLVFETDTTKAVTLSDAGGFIDGGTINRRTLILDGAGTHTVTFDVTESSRGYVGVSIATQEVLYAEVIRSPTPSPFAGASGTTGWLGGASIVLISFVGAGIWVVYNEGGEPTEASP
ncbi:hypothetical protein [Halobacterium litoreum]|uniref:Uncharacterized protein n=1 Tax=Halobacterium litoreum TaxID=2039234 RepID=A0ABD5NIC8_9EURY|nr:hypothetical protein [Halobacterium litoreum]UHH12419.1 hypothetical protein LT972_09640 [Halobacterium litoreum]